MILFKIHGVDSLGSFTIDCSTFEEYHECWNNLQMEPDVDELWFEVWDEDVRIWRKNRGISFEEFGEALEILQEGGQS